MEWTAKLSTLRKEKGNKDSETNFQDIFLRLKIGLTLELSWEKPEQMKSSHIKCSQEHDKWAQNLVKGHCFTPQVQFSCKSHFKATKVTMYILEKCAMQLYRGFNLMTLSSLHFPKLKVENGGEERLLFEVNPLSSFIWQISVGVDTWLATRGPGSLSQSRHIRRKGGQIHTDVWHQSCAPGHAASRTCKRKLDPACVGKEEHSIPARPAGEAGIETREQRQSET